MFITCYRLTKIGSLFHFSTIHMNKWPIHWNKWHLKIIFIIHKKCCALPLPWSNSLNLIIARTIIQNLKDSWNLQNLSWGNLVEWNIKINCKYFLFSSFFTLSPFATWTTTLSHLLVDANNSSNLKWKLVG